MAMADDEAEIIQFFHDYAADFGRLGIQPLLHYFNRPCMAIAPQGAFALTSDVEIEQLFEPRWEQLQAQGYVLSRWLEMRVRLLNEHIALASNIAAHYDEAGQELERTAGTYVLHRGEKGWKIATLIVHSPDIPLPF